MTNAAELAAANAAVCKELGLHFWKSSDVAQGADVYRCQVRGFEALVIVASDGWWRCWPMHQEAEQSLPSWMGFGPAKLEERLSNPAHVRSKPGQWTEVRNA